MFLCILSVLFSYLSYKLHLFLSLDPLSMVVMKRWRPRKLCKVNLAEWLRRETWNLMGSPAQVQILQLTLFFLINLILIIFFHINITTFSHQTPCASCGTLASSPPNQSTQTSSPLSDWILLFNLSSLSDRQMSLPQCPASLFYFQKLTLCPIRSIFI